jgi:hypothetical protein
MRFNDGSGNGTGFPGNYVGLDYMLMFNIYNLMKEKVSSYLPETATVYPTVPSYFTSGINWPITPQIPQDYPFVVYTFPNYYNYGFNTSPYIFSSGFCSQGIYIDQLDVQNGGGLILNPGLDSYADLKPTAGNIIITQGGYCDILPKCCNSNVVPYNNEFTDFQTLCAIKPGSIPPYQKSNEFDTIFAYNGIKSYPNPFIDQTSILFSLKNDSPISIYITDVSGKKISDIIKNEPYKKGNYTLNYNGYNLASGNYICVLETNNYRYTYKMLKNH